MNKSALIAKIAEKSGMTKVDVTKMLDATIESIKEGVKETGNVALVGFGSFNKTHRKAGKTTVPGTSKEVSYPARDSASFKAGKEFKDFLNS
jgi:DNA-binding protein HU-beta